MISIATLAKLCESGATEFEIKFAKQHKLESKELWKVVDEHNLFNPDAVDEDEEHVHTLTLKDIHAIAAIWHLDTDFSIAALPSNELGIMVHAIQSHAITPEEQALGSFTRQKLKKLDTWPLWAAGEWKQLNHFHSLQMYGDPVDHPPGAIVLFPHWQYSIKHDGTHWSHVAITARATAFSKP
jgi:uncharacterized protein (DUF952 family)